MSLRELCQAQSKKGHRTTWSGQDNTNMERKKMKMNPAVMNGQGKYQRELTENSRRHGGRRPRGQSRRDPTHLVSVTYCCWTNNPTSRDQRSIIDWQGCVPSWGIKEEWAPLPLPASRGFPYCLARGPLHTSLPTSASHRHFPSSDSSCLPPVQTLVFTLGPPDILGKSLHLSIFNLLTSAKFLLPYEVTYSQVPELGRRQLWGPGLYLLHTLFLRTIWNRRVMWSFSFFFFF